MWRDIKEELFFQVPNNAKNIPFFNFLSLHGNFEGHGHLFAFADKSLRDCLELDQRGHIVEDDTFVIS